MPISFQCRQCGRSYTTSEQWAGKSVKCKQCGQTVKVPIATAASTPPPPVDIYGLEELAAGAALTPRSGPSRPPLASRSDERGTKSPKNPKKQTDKRSFFSNKLPGGVWGGFCVAFIVLFNVFTAYNRYQRRQAREHQEAEVAAAVQNFQLTAPPPPAVDASWSMPAIPALSTGSELEPGVLFYEMKLPGGSAPAHSGKLWLYLPAGDHPPKSLGCICIAGAGTNLITGMELGDGDRPEHLPYVKAGFAVLAYELDGMVPENAPKNDAAFLPYIRAFVNAQAGLLNARVAMEFATTRVPAIDPRRFYAAGHSSAATLALLVAENEPRIAACLAYAPAADIASQIPPELQRALSQLVPGVQHMFGRFNPRSGEAKIQCPVFLFYADDDARFAPQVRELAQRLKSSGKNVTLESVATGGHYESMLETGVPRGIEWLKTLPK